MSSPEEKHKRRRRFAQKKKATRRSESEYGSHRERHRSCRAQKSRQDSWLI
ncbi:MAG: hypothetical protein GY832_34580 [Chloroflexi bacterium]|nr:hypothetical protein [Chloroflexota bacterium]